MQQSYSAFSTTPASSSKVTPPGAGSWGRGYAGSLNPPPSPPRPLAVVSKLVNPATSPTWRTSCCRSTSTTTTRTPEPRLGHNKRVPALSLCLRGGRGQGNHAGPLRRLPVYWGGHAPPPPARWVGAAWSRAWGMSWGAEPGAGVASRRRSGDGSGPDWTSAVTEDGSGNRLVDSRARPRASCASPQGGCEDASRTALRPEGGGLLL